MNIVSSSSSIPFFPGVSGNAPTEGILEYKVYIKLEFYLRFRKFKRIIND